MIRPLVLALVATVGIGVVSMTPPTYLNYERPQVNVPVALRQHNWGARGSCVHASLVTALRWQGQHAMAQWWRTHHSGGESVESLGPAMDAAGVVYAQTYDQDDVAFLEWAVATRRGCVVAVNGYRHAVFLAHLDGSQAGLIGVNFTSPVIWVDREEFLTEWRASRSWAVAVIYSPAPPLASGR